MSFQNWFGKDIEQDLDDEFRDHIEREIAENIARGLTPADARRQALLAFDGIARSKEACREQWGLRIVKDLKQDLRYGLRMLLRSPAFSCVAIVTLALGMGTNAALFNGINALLLRPLPVFHPTELFNLKRDELALRSYSFRQQRGSPLPAIEPGS